MAQPQSRLPSKAEIALYNNDIEPLLERRISERPAPIADPGVYTRDGNRSQRHNCNGYLCDAVKAGNEHRLDTIRYMRGLSWDQQSSERQGEQQQTIFRTQAAIRNPSTAAPKVIYQQTSRL